jgi:hypothetical protein
VSLNAFGAGWPGHWSDENEMVVDISPPRVSKPGRLPAAGPLRLGAVDLGEGRPVIARPYDDERSQPAPLWLTDAAVPDAGAAWWALVEQFPATGLWPLLLRELGDSDRPWDTGELQPVSEAEVDLLDPLRVLEFQWHDCLVPINYRWAPGTGPLAPFGPEFPGLAPPQTEMTPVLVSAGGSARLGLVSCRRPADAVALIGWLGAINLVEPAKVSAVLRSWEDRFGVILAGLGFATMTLLVTRPPTSDDDALLLAAEMAALCRDALWQPEEQWPYEPRDLTFEALSRTLVRQPLWRLWWD